MVLLSVLTWIAIEVANDIVLQLHWHVGAYIFSDIVRTLEQIRDGELVWRGL